MGEYQTAQICPNGHVATDSANRYPEQKERFCSRCGEETLTNCPHCQTPIRGDYYVEGVLAVGGYEPPGFCHNCGAKFPWTERKISAAVELLEAGGTLSKEELQQFQQDLSELTKDSPKVQVASLRFKNMMKKVGESAASGVRDIVVDILSEAAKKAIWGG